MKTTMESHEQKISDGVAGAMPLAESIFDTLARDTADPAGGVTRASWGEGEQYAHRLLAKSARDVVLGRYPQRRSRSACGAA
jgi:hypothetical protein